MSEYEHIAIWLSAAAANASPDQQANNFVSQEANTLYVQESKADGVSAKTPIVQGVKNETPVVLLGDNKVFAVDENNTLVCHVKQEGDGKPGELWPEQSLGAGNITIHPESQLCAIEFDGHVTVFHQDTEGVLSSLHGHGGSWTVAKLPAANCALGTPLSYCPHMGKEHLLYVTEDGYVRTLVKEEGEEHETWEDEAFSPARLRGPASKILGIATEVDDGQVTLNVFGLVSSQLVLVEGTSKDAIILGMMRKGMFSSARGCVVRRVVRRPCGCRRPYGSGGIVIYGDNYGPIRQNNW